MKHTISLAILAFLALGLSAQGLSVRDRMALRSADNQAAVAAQGPARISTIADNSVKTAQGKVFAIVRLADGADASSLADEGVVVMGSRHGFAFLCLDADRAESVAGHSAVKQFSLSHPVMPKLDKARQAVGVDKVHQGIDLPQGYTGKGVITGIVDTGFDPNHPNFINEADGTNRIQMLSRVSISSSNELVQRVYTNSEIANFSSDDNTTYHGTHTLGIMAGGWRGEAVVSTPTGQGNTCTVGNAPNPYYGVAPDAIPVVGAGSAYDALIAYNIDAICEYAYNRPEPLVINLSLGSNSGPHDGTAAMNQYLDAIAENDGAIICISSGNEGDKPIAVNKTFTKEDSVLQTFLHPGVLSKPDYDNIRVGTVDIYSSNDQTFKLDIVVYNRSRQRVAWRGTLTGNSDNKARYYVTSSKWSQSETDAVDPTLAKWFDGYIGMGSSLDPYSGRYYAVVDCNLTEDQTNNANSNYIVGIQVTGKPGQRIDCFGDGTYMTLSDFGVEGWTNGSTNGSVSDMATGHNVIVVGSCNSREIWPSLDGFLHADYGVGQMTPGEVTFFSSYGTLVDGRNLPHVLAPGAAVLSSISQPYINYAKLHDETNFSANAKANGRNGYYTQMIGTSMACPFVAGVIALWLEADPTLDVNQIKEIIQKTCVAPDGLNNLADPAQAGWGIIDAYAGLKEVLRLTGIQSIVADNTTAKPIVHNLSDKTYSVFLANAQEMTVKVVDLAGRIIATAEADSDEVTLDLNGFPAGVYILSINNKFSERILIK